MLNSVYFITFGCKVNLAETEKMRLSLLSKGFVIAESEEKADIFVINSCTVTDTADKKLKKTISRLRREYRNAVIAVMGCYTELKSLENVDIMVGTADRDSLPDKLFELLPQKEVFSDFQIFPDNTRAFLKIQDGCSCNCSYCIIPKARGGFCSKPLEEIGADAKAFAAAGFKEIVLTGINIGFYGIENSQTLSDAVLTVSENAPFARIRLGSLEPERMTDLEIEKLGEIKNLCPHFHLSLQSACDRTLQVMNRRYTVGEYIAVAEKLRQKFPNTAITTDVIVGFPGETEEDFNDSCENIKKIGFSDIHIFPYSKREGTKAALMENQIPENIKHKRAKVLSEIVEDMRHDFAESMKGKTLKVLFEKEKTPGVHVGFTENYLPYTVKNNDYTSWRNQIKEVVFIPLPNCL
jgi:threonylcarbamoyladenosine tRNA methylthiotransferase MtaB